MSITFTIPRMSDVARAVLPLGEPFLIALAAAVGLGPVGQALCATALRAVQHNLAN